MVMCDGRCVLRILFLVVIINETTALNLGETQSIVLSPARKLVARYKRQESTNAKLPDIIDMHIDSEVRSRFATVKVSSALSNKESEDLEASFIVQIPESAFISNFTMIINDIFYVGKVYEKKKAQEKYNQAREQGQSAGQVRHRELDVARAMDVFELNVNVAAESTVNFELTYQELLERKLGLYVQRFVVQPLQVVDNLTLDMRYIEQQDISRFEFRLPHDKDVRHTSSSPVDHASLEATSLSRRLVYTPPVSVQRQMDVQTGMNGEMVVSYDVAHPVDGGSIVSAGNYFVHYFAFDKSQTVKVEAKNVIFVIDISGSMSGRKIEQTRDAMLGILPQLNDVDYFNIMLFDDRPVVWQSGPIPATPSNIAQAKVYVEYNVKARGGTNINSALLDSVNLVANALETADSVGMVVFLTDGRPTAGVTELELIRQNVKSRNENRVAIFCLGFGQGVDFGFLSAISFENNGFPRRIYEESDAAQQLDTFFKEVSNPTCRDVQFKYNPNKVVVADLSQTEYKTYFSGSEIVVVGKTKERMVEARVECVTKDRRMELIVPPTSIVEESGSNGQFTEKLYAYKIIKYLLRKMSIAGSKDEAARLESKALSLSLNFNFVTPLTSLVVVQDEDEQSQPTTRTGIESMDSMVKSFSVGASHCVKGELIIGLLALVVALTACDIRSPGN